MRKNVFFLFQESIIQSPLQTFKIDGNKTDLHILGLQNKALIKFDVFSKAASGGIV